MCSRRARSLPVQLVLVEQQAERAPRLAADEDVLGDGQVIHQLEFLMNDPDPSRLRLARIGEGDLLAAVKDCPAVFCIDAGENLHQRRFAGAVLAHQRMDLART